MTQEQIMNEQIRQKLLVYNYDLKKMQKDHYLEYFSLLALASAWILISMQIIRYFIK